ncbi:MAG: hypothetical protein COT81_03425 [Candidatus Buchananbacteria bacterium CG10_big_fil_rev_8_21_14_0_10_42_9]|uniref:V-type ATP synthase subunit I n=1 Tax=Candidatus Buchananbacteria bacterium CG10_big_fil_rev_8_21_14_0_10_42_9 TaxID=1974526 RepID=A0A2H0W0U7_9BACT|nr:MAG: hypothetical protein COT81_03425 [Candidatus Buchananbacteria bacterium CG10_big_fil_rev_8_21_14_0_10_42_9]
MASSQIKKINIIFKQSESQKVLETLQNLSLVHLENESEQTPYNEKLASLEKDSANLLFAINFLTPYYVDPKGTLDKILDPKIAVSEKQAVEIANQTNWSKIVSQAQKLEQSISDLEARGEKLIAEQELLSPWENLSFVPMTKDLPKNFHLLFASAPNEIFDKLLKFSATKEIEIAKVNAIGTESYFSIIFKDKSLTELPEWQQVKFVELPELDDKIIYRLEAIKRELKINQSKIDDAKKEAETLAKNVANLKIISDLVDWQLQQAEKVATASTTEQTAILTGWVANSDLKTVNKRLHETTSAIAVIEQPIGKDDNVPVQLRNKGFRPFEAITGIYGSPLAGEPDPTPWLAPFFIIFFGLCLTDAGYGAVLAGLSFLALKLMKVGAEAKKLLKVLVYGGIATFVLGALAGGWFGIAIDTITIEPIRNILQQIRLIDPVADPITMLIISLILGVIQVLVGLVVNIWWKVKHGQISEALWGSGVWFYTLSMLMVWIMAKSEVLPPVTLIPSLYLLYLGLALVVISGMRQTKNLFLKPVIGILGLYNIVGYFSDVLSYSRLLALGLATGIIASVINLIAFLAADLVPYVGWVLTIGILIGGHIFNMAINVLGAYIHSGRLQFVEFFPKFMEGGGKTFEPFSKQSRFVRITK